MDYRYELLQRWLKEQLAQPAFVMVPLDNDASFRRYYRIEQDTQSWIAADMPPAKENPTVFNEITQMLRAQSLHAPEIKACNLSEGLFLLEDLGDLTYLLARETTDSNLLYQRAIDALLKIQQIDSDGLAPFDSTSLLEEMNLYTDWYCHIHLKKNLSQAEIKALAHSYQLLIQSALAQPQVFVHRDYHSRNLMWTPDETVGVLDYQDAVAGPLSYDLVSLLKDCYVEWPDAQRMKWIEYYLDHTPHDLDQAEFVRWFEWMGIQRHLKAVGIFARLKHRDGKDNFLASIPLTLSYILDTAPRYPELADFTEIVGRMNP